MKKAHLSDMVKGWFVGNFTPSAFINDRCEVALKTYQKGDKDAAHFHKLAYEITLIVEGEVIMMESKWRKGDIIVIEPGEVSTFSALTDATLVVIKIPGAKDDKYPAELP